MEELNNNLNEEEALDPEGDKWLIVYPNMQEWTETHSDMVEWMTETTKFPPRSDCG
tara:strand:- start:178 stop:345 length:168 start_codon:yes stop_codon:yes gene_type:complete